MESESEGILKYQQQTVQKLNPIFHPRLTADIHKKNFFPLTKFLNAPQR